MTKIERAKRPFVVTAEIEHLTDLLGGQEPAIQRYIERLEAERDAAMIDATEARRQMGVMRGI